MIKLFKDQEKIMTELFEKPKENTLISSPSGSGKTYLIAATVKRVLKNTKAFPLIIANSIEIREQISTLFEKFNINPDRYVIASSFFILNHSKDFKKKISHILIDEAHHTMASTYLQIINDNPKAVVYGFTATPIRNDNKQLGKIYSRIIYGLSIKSLISRKRLAPFEYYAPNRGKNSISTIIDSRYLKINNNDYQTGGLRNLTVRKTIYDDILKTYMNHIPNEQAILFAHSISAAKKYVKTFNDKGISAVFLSSTLPKKKREKIITDFRNGEIKVLCNYNIISEGFDVPDVSNVIMARPTDSLIIYMQQAARAIRYKKGKVAKIFDHANNLSRHGLLDADRCWSLDIESIKGTSISSRNREFGGKQRPFLFKKDVKLSKIVKEKHPEFDKEIKAALKLKNPMDKIKALTVIQNKYGIQSVSSLSWVGAMIQKYKIPITSNP